MQYKRSKVRISSERMQLSWQTVRVTDPDLPLPYQEALAECLARLPRDVFDDYVSRGCRYGEVPEEVESIFRPALWPISFALALARHALSIEAQLPGREGKDRVDAVDTDVFDRVKEWGFSQEDVDDWLSEYSRVQGTLIGGRVRIYGLRPKGM